MAMFVGPPQNAPQSDPVKVIAVARIKFIDTKKNTIIIGTPQRPPRGGPGSGAGSRGPGFPPGGPPHRGGRQSDSKVIISANTLIHEDSNDIGIADLRVGDSLKVTGRPRNKDIEATDIVRLRRKRN